MNECYGFHQDGVCTCNTYTISSPDIENGWEYTVKAVNPYQAAEQFISEHDSDSLFAHSDMCIEVMVADKDGKEHSIDVFCEVEFKYTAT